MKTIWDRISVWLAANAPAVAESLHPGATDRKIRAVERKLGLPLPEDVKASYRIHDGQKLVDEGFLYGRRMNRLDDMVKARDFLDSPAWVPIASGERGEFFCLDLSNEGSGRILLWWPDLDYDDEGPAVMARSFTSW